MVKYKHLTVKKVQLADFAPEKKVRELSARQRAVNERDGELRAVMNEAAALASSEAVAIEITADQKVATIRAAIGRIIKAEPRDLNWGIRGNFVLVSKGLIPRGRRSR